MFAAPLATRSVTPGCELPDFVATLNPPRLAAAPAGPKVGAIYYDTTANKEYYWNGTSWVDMSGGGGGALNWSDVGTGAAGGGAGVAYGTTLPASPVDGIQAILVDSTTNPSYQWHFRYNVGSSSTYKWEYVGGAPLEARNNASAAVPTPGSWNSDGALQMTVPRLGEYDISFGCEFVGAAASNLCAMTAAVGGTYDFTLQASIYIYTGGQSSVART